MRLIFIITVALLAGCSKTRTTEGLVNTEDSINYSTKDHSDQLSEHHKKIDIDSVLKNEDNSFLAHLTNGTLSLCCYDLLNITLDLEFDKFRKTIEEYKESDSIADVVNVYTFGNSFVKTYYNDHPNVKRMDLVCGQILSEEIDFNDDIKIGMEKNELLGKLFRESVSFDQINTLEIFENELGEASTIYIFKDDKLREIRFDSSYDWITKELKK